ncbi:MAG: phosphatase domain-containing protein [Nitrososphaerales archaeon]
MPFVFVTDASYKHTLAAIRTLRRSGHVIACGDSLWHAVSFFSTATNERRLYPSPKHNPVHFVNTILKLAETEGFDAVLPVSYDACLSLTKLSQNFPKALLPTPRSMAVASDKARTQQLASSLNILTPLTRIVCDVSELYSISKDIGFPLILKDTYGSGRNIIVRSPDMLEKAGVKLHNYSTGRVIAQEYISGEGYGFFSLFLHGKKKSSFMHRRIREATLEGGSSTCAESFFDEELAELGSKLLTDLGWNGVAMVEFKRDKQGQYYLLEINPKLWGSLDLAIQSGVDFPNQIVDCITKGDCDEINRYAIGMRFQWPFPDDATRAFVDHSVAKDWISDLMNHSVKKNILPSDPVPTIILVGHTLLKIAVGSRKHNTLQGSTFELFPFQIKRTLLHYFRSQKSSPKNYRVIEPDLIATSGQPVSQKQVDWLIRHEGIRAILSLTEKNLKQLGFNLDELQEYKHVPMVDHLRPTQKQIDEAINFISNQYTRQSLLIHCEGGKGRTGVVLACFFGKRFHRNGFESVSVVRKISPDYIEGNQEKAVHDYLASNPRMDRSA